MIYPWTELSPAAVSAGGCGGPTILPVSGTVRLDGKPYQKAVVSFQPIGDKGNPNSGRGSVGVTDETGQFTLTYDGTRPGALIGKHRVRIFTEFGAKPPVDDKTESDPNENVGAFRERIPSDWNERSEKVFKVSAGGTDKADFNIVTKK